MNKWPKNWWGILVAIFVLIGLPAFAQEPANYDGEIRYLRQYVPYSVTVLPESAVHAAAVYVSATFNERQLDIEVKSRKSVRVSYGLEAAGWGSTERAYFRNLEANPDATEPTWSDDSTFPLWNDLPLGVGPAILDDVSEDSDMREAFGTLIFGLSKIKALQARQIDSEKARVFDPTSFVEERSSAARCGEDSYNQWGGAVIAGKFQIPGVPISIEGNIGLSDGTSECFDAPPPECEASPQGAITALTEERILSECPAPAEWYKFQWDKVKETKWNIKNHHSQDISMCKAAGEDKLVLADARLMFGNVVLNDIAVGRLKGNMTHHARLGGSLTIVTCYEENGGFIGEDAEATFTSSGVYACFNEPECNGEM